MENKNQKDRIKSSELKIIVDELDMISKKWVVQIIRELRTRDLSFKELRNRLDGVSNKILSERLEQLRAKDFIQKQDGEYLTTSKGSGLGKVFKQILEWHREHEG